MSGSGFLLFLFIERTRSNERAFLSAQDMSNYDSLDNGVPAQNKTVIIGLMAATGVVLLLTILGTVLPQGQATGVDGIGRTIELTTNAWKTTSDAMNTNP
jgi:hypothetical protein